MTACAPPLILSGPRSRSRPPGQPGSSCREGGGDLIQPEGEAPYDHVRAFVDFQPCRYLRWRGDAGYLADLLPWALPLLERLGIEAGKAEARCFR